MSSEKLEKSPPIAIPGLCAVGWWPLVPYLVKCRRATNRATQTSHVTLLLQCHSSTQCQCHPDQQCFTQSQFFGVTCNSVKVPNILVHCAHCNPSPNSDQSQSRPQSVLSLFSFNIHYHPLPSISIHPSGSNSKRDNCYFLPEIP